jgi:PAS domain-containing protein
VDEFQFPKKQAGSMRVAGAGEFFVDREFDAGPLSPNHFDAPDTGAIALATSLGDTFVSSRPGNASVAAPSTGRLRKAIQLGTTEFKATANFRQTIENLGASAAIITYTRMRPIERRQIFMVGLHEYADQPILTYDLIEFAESAWLQIENDGLRLTQLETMRAETSFCCDTNRINDMLMRFDHMAFSHYAPDINSQLRIALFRHASEGAFGLDLRAVLPVVQPILAEIAGAQMDAQRAQRRISILEGMLDTVSHGVILLDAKARPFYANDVAHEMIADAGIFTVGNDQILRCASSESTHIFHTAVQKAVGGLASSSEVIVKLQGRHGRSYLGFLTPASGRDDQSGNRAAFLFIHDMKVHAASPALMGAFGLLPSEQRFLGAFLESPSLAEAATRLGLSEETARTYVKRICSKVGVRRQLELASVMFGITPPIRQKRIKASESSFRSRQPA